MSQRNGPIYRLLSVPNVYEAIQTAFGSDHFRKCLVQNDFGLREGDRVLDIGCGTAGILNYLPSVEYIGYEPDRSYVERARKVFGSRAKFHVGLFDGDAARSMEPVDLALLLGVLHHVSDSQARELFQRLRSVLKTGGRVVTVDPVYTDPQNRLARLAMWLDRGRQIRTADHYASLAQESFACVGGRVVHTPFPPYSRWIMHAA